jgi:hypothetical protein
MFIAEHKDGVPTPGDDIVEIKWFDIETLINWSDKGAPVVDTHVPLLAMLRNKSREIPEMLKVWGQN